MDHEAEQKRKIPPVLLADGEPAHTRRRHGYVTEQMCRQHGGYRAALNWLNSQEIAA